MAPLQLRNLFLLLPELKNLDHILLYFRVNDIDSIQPAKTIAKTFVNLALKIKYELQYKVSVSEITPRKEELNKFENTAVDLINRTNLYRYQLHDDCHLKRSREHKQGLSGLLLFFKNMF